jgi:antitoxin YqcF
MKHANRPSIPGQEIARITAHVFDVKRPIVSRFVDDNSMSSIDILEAGNKPDRGLISYATVGLSAHILLRDGKDYGAGVELLGVCRSESQFFGNVLATAAFCIINSRWFCAPGIIFPNVIPVPDTPMKNIYFAYPFPWQDAFVSRSLHERTVAWLLAVPVTDAETELASRFGPAELERQLEGAGIDLFDLNRASIV